MTGASCEKRKTGTNNRVAHITGAGQDRDRRHCAARFTRIAALMLQWRERDGADEDAVEEVWCSCSLHGEMLNLP
jgi:hypothetical protein